NTSRRQCLPGGTAPRCSPRRAVLPAQCGSSLRPNTASASPGGCRGQASRAYQRWKRISVSSSLLGGYDEPEILRSSSCQICLTGAEAGQSAQTDVNVLTYGKWALEMGRKVKTGQKALRIKGYHVPLFHFDQTEVMSPAERKEYFALQQAKAAKREA